MSKSSYDDELLKFNMYKESKNDGVSDDESGFSVAVDIFSVAIFYMLEDIRKRLTRLEARQDLIVKAMRNKKG